MYAVKWEGNRTEGKNINLIDIKASVSVPPREKKKKNNAETSRRFSIPRDEFGKYFGIFFCF